MCIDITEIAKGRNYKIIKKSSKSLFSCKAKISDIEYFN
ncbi:hypothetical protein L291_3240 [Acinetobacter guillouiae MSP4-18]|nr:hypothetical protein L291_3240 [Acinetobacter guillouiae MSP4-18]